MSQPFSFSRDEEALEKEVLGGIKPNDELITLALDDSVKAALDARISKHWLEKRKLAELREFLFSDDELGVRYDALSSRTATGTYYARSGNCLAMTNLFIAAARYIGLDANYQTIVVKPTWDHEGETMIRYEHIVAVGSVGLDSYVMDFLPGFVVGDRPTEDITDRQAMALYYNNLGAEAVVNQRPTQAIDYLRHALALNLEHTDIWNNMGAAMRRSGDDRLAEFSYIRALDIDPDNFSALSNLGQFYQSTGQQSKAKKFAARVERYRKRNPYFNYFLARVFFEEGRYEDSALILKKSIRLKRDEPMFYEALAKTYKKLGADRKSREQLALAEKYRTEDLSALPSSPVRYNRSFRSETGVRYRAYMPR